MVYLRRKQAQEPKMCERVFIFMNTLEYKPLCTIHEYEYKPLCTIYEYEYKPPNP